MKISNAEIFEKAIEVIERDGWCKGSLLTNKGERCLEGALMFGVLGRTIVVVSKNDETYGLWHKWILRYNELKPIVLKAIQGCNSHSASNPVCMLSPWTWNDQEETTKEDVIQILYIAKAMS